MTRVTAASPFEDAAATYDETFTRTAIGTRMRAAVWRRLDAAFAPGSRVLELGCGTGEDALHLALRGVRVRATDAAEAMVREARTKADLSGVGGLVETAVLGANRLDELGDEPFDGALSNFGALNCVPELAPVASGLARLVRPRGRVVLCLLGRYVPWEWAWFLARGRRDAAFRRLAKGGVEWRGIRVQYPPLRELRRTFDGGFRVTGVRAVGAFLPPTYAEGWAIRHPRLLGALDAVERSVGAFPPFPSLADHVLLELERR
jgi:SAM-dependent methyltransferase